MTTYEFPAFLRAEGKTEAEARARAEELVESSSRSPEGTRVSLDDGSGEVVDDDDS